MKIFTGCERDTKLLRVCIDARLVPGKAGGVEQALLGLAYGLSQLEEGEEEYLFWAYSDHTEWLMPYMKGSCKVVSNSPAPRPRHLPSFALPLKRNIRHVWEYVSPIFYRTVHIPVSDGFAEQLGADLVHFPTPAGFLTKLPFIYQPWDLQHRHLPQFFTPAQRHLRDTSYKALCDAATYVVTATTWSRQDIIQQYGLSKQKVRLVAGAAQPTVGEEPVATQLQEVRERYSLPVNFLFYPAQTWAHKNHINLLHALKLLREREQIIIPLVCSGRQNEYYPEIAKVVNQLHLSQQVKFIGYASSSDIRCLYRLCRGLIFPSYFEGFGIPVLEAFATQTPVACSNVTCLPELAGNAALLFDPHNPVEIADAIKKLWIDPLVCQELVVLGENRIKHLSWLQIARTFRAYYRIIVGRGNDADHLLMQQDSPYEP